MINGGTQIISNSITNNQIHDVSFSKITNTNNVITNSMLNLSTGSLNGNLITNNSIVDSQIVSLSFSKITGITDEITNSMLNIA